MSEFNRIIHIIGRAIWRFLCAIGRSFQFCGKRISKSSDVANLKSKITETEAVLGKLYGEIGRNYFETHADAPEELLSELCGEVASNRELIAETEAGIEELQQAFDSELAAAREEAQERREADMAAAAEEKERIQEEKAAAAAAAEAERAAAEAERAAAEAEEALEAEYVPAEEPDAESEPALEEAENPEEPAAEAEEETITASVD